MMISSARPPDGGGDFDSRSPARLMAAEEMIGIIFDGAERIRAALGEVTL